MCGLVTSGALRARCIVMVDMIDLADVEGMLLAAYGAPDALGGCDAEGGEELAARQPAAPTICCDANAGGGEGLAAEQPTAAREVVSGAGPVAYGRIVSGVGEGGRGGVSVHHEQTVGLAVRQPASPAPAGEVVSGVEPSHYEQIDRGGGGELAIGVDIDHGHFN